MIPVIKIPAPMAHQRRVLEAGGRFKVVVAGRRWGKTILGLIACIIGHGPGRCFRGALYGKIGMWVAPTKQISADIWRALKTALGGSWLEKNEVERRIVFPGGGSITVRSADEPNNLRGPGLDFLVIDEAAYVAVDAWVEVLRPTLADRQGWAIFISTPKGQNWFWKLFEDARITPGWRRWQLQTSENPKIPPSELEAARVQMGSYAFAQEHLAEFVQPGGGLFKREDARYYGKEKLPNGTWLAVLDNGETLDPAAMSIFVTVDTATSTKTAADFTAIAAWGSDARGRLFLLDLDMRRLEGPQIMRQIVVMCERWRTIAYIEENATSKHLLSFMDSQGVPYRTVSPGTTDKRTRALPASAMWERHGIFLPRELPRRMREPFMDPEYEAERDRMLPEAERQLFAFTGAKEKESKSTGANDDFVDALAYAARVFLDEFGNGEGSRGLDPIGDLPPLPGSGHLPPGIGLSDPFKPNTSGF